MADPNFFKKSKSHSIKELLQLLSDKVKIEVDNFDQNSNFILEDICALKNAGSTDLSFLDNAKYKKDFQDTKAGACFIHPDLIDIAPPNIICLKTKKPYKAYALATQIFYPHEKPESHIAPSSSIHPSATIGQYVTIEPNVYIGAGVSVGEHCWIEANAVIKDNVQIGDHCRIGANTTISHALIQDYVRLYSGVRVGQDGFGFAIDPAGHVKVMQLGRVIIEDHVEIGANTTIDRGAGPDTIIGQGSWIDNLVQIGHNVQMGMGCVIVSQVGISGSTKLGDFVAVGGQVGIAGHLNIGTGARIGAQSGVINDLEPMKEYLGSPAVPKMTFFRQVAALNRLIKKKKTFNYGSV